ncbi:MAG: type II toxin-antitoxin system RelE/ParE family toxin [Armatimonadota bacterium]
MYKGIYDHRVLKEDFQEIDKKNQKDIFKIIEKKILRDPEKFGQRMRAPLSSCYKLKVGSYRIIYIIKESIITIFKIGHRRSVYEKLLKRF